MSIKSAIRLFVPPILLPSVRPTIPSSPPRYEPKETFAQAVSEAGDGHNSRLLTSAFQDRSTDLSNMPDFAAPFFAGVAAASIKAGRRLKILDVGAASGHLRAHANRFFNDGVPADWVLVETPSQVNFVGDLGRNDIRYATEAPPEKFDLAIFCGSLQYIPDWRAALDLDADMIFIARTPLGEREQPFLQRHFMVDKIATYPARVISRDDLFGLLNQTHRLACLWKFEAHLIEMGLHEAPAMLWERRDHPLAEGEQGH